MKDLVLFIHILYFAFDVEQDGKEDMANATTTANAKTGAWQPVEV